MAGQVITMKTAVFELRPHQSVVLAVGARGRRRKGLVYVESEVARSHGAGVSRETTDPPEAYGGFAGWRRSLYQAGWLPDL